MASLRNQSRSAAVRRAIQLLGTTSLLTAAGIAVVRAQPAADVEEVLVTGSLIHGASAVGIPVTSLGTADFQDQAAVTISDVLKTVSSVSVTPAPSVQGCTGCAERQSKASMRGLDTGNAPRTLVLVDSLRIVPAGHGLDGYDPSVVPAIAVDHVDVLADGASATYGSDAVAGVINLILRRRFDGATTQLRYGMADGGGATWQASQLYGTKWGSGDITLSYEWYDEKELPASARDYYTYDFRPWGLDDRTPLRSSMPGVVTTGAPANASGTPAGFSATQGTQYCANCYSVPHGTGWDFGSQAPGPTTSWTTLLANAGSGNEVNPYTNIEATSPLQRNAATVAFDQTIFPGVEFFATGFYSNRRSQVEYAPIITPWGQNNSFTQAVPTSNPYYPVGAPAGLRVSYSLTDESKPTLASIEISKRYSGGFNLDLPYDWRGTVGFTKNEEHSLVIARTVNLNMISAAVGNTVAATAANGSTPGQAAFTKPSNIPYLNLFCDQTEFQCNSPATLAYISAFRNYNTTYSITQVASNFDGPLFDLPGGTVRAAIGGSYVRDNYYFDNRTNYNTPNTSVPTVSVDTEGRKVYAFYGQLNVPLVGDTNAMPFVKKLDVEASYRLDHYDLFGWTKNPKFSVNYVPVEGLTLRGTWGTSFRAPAFSDTSTITGKLIMPVNVLGGAASDFNSVCATVGATPLPGSVAALLNPTCSGATALRFAGGLSVSGPSGGLSGVARPSGFVLNPESSTNYSFGFEFAPTDFLKGLDIDVTYFKIHIKNAIAGASADVNDPAQRQFILVRGNPDGQNVTDFDTALNALLADPVSQVPTNVTRSNILFIQDQAVRNIGGLKLDGIDVRAGYDWDMGDLGAWSTGLTGTYYIHRTTDPGLGIVPSEAFLSNDALPGETRSIRMTYRARLGWSMGNYSVTGFMNYQSHYFTTQAYPPSCFITGPVCFAGAGQFPNYSNFIPAFYTFDLSLGYTTGDQPANEYLKNLRLQLVANNVLNKQPPFAYRVASNGGSSAYDGSNFGPFGRMISLTITKNW